MHAHRRSLPFEHWPQADQALWHDVIREGDILDGAGTGREARDDGPQLRRGRLLALLERRRAARAAAAGTSRG